MNRERAILLSAYFAGTITVALSQESVDKGSLSASFETNTIYYIEDDKTGAQVPIDNIGSNNYLKVDYTYKGFTTGFQIESYQPALYGYPSELEGSKFINYYAGWAKDNFTDRKSVV